MTTEADPIIGNWYQHLDKGQKFEVVAFDKDEGLVEIQHFDGTVDEINLDVWYELDIEPIEAPEDWTGPVDDIERDDLDATETDMAAEDWSEPLQDLRRDREQWEKYDSQALQDKLGEGYPQEEPREEDDEQ